MRKTETETETDARAKARAKLYFDFYRKMMSVMLYRKRAIELYAKDPHISWFNLLLAAQSADDASNMAYRAIRRFGWG